MAQWLGAQVILAEDRVQFPAPHSGSQPEITPVPEDLAPEGTQHVHGSDNFKSLIELPCLVEKEEE